MRIANFEAGASQRENNTNVLEIDITFSIFMNSTIHGTAFTVHKKSKEFFHTTVVEFSGISLKKVAYELIM